MVQAEAAAKAARAAAGIDEVDAVQEEAVNPEAKSAKKSTGFMEGIRKGMHERALAAAMVQQQSLLAGAAYASYTAASGEGEDTMSKQEQDQQVRHPTL
jgi:hypothetical protein